MRKSLMSAMAVAMAATLTLTACGGTTAAASSAATEAAASAVSEEATGEGYKPMKIAFAAQAVDETFVEAKNALENEIGPALNIEFMSPKLSAITVR